MHLSDVAGFIGPGIVMCGIQLAGGEWLLGAEITARYGGSLMWIASVAIIGQVFYNMECGRYALYTGEPVFTGFMPIASIAPSTASLNLKSRSSIRYLGRASYGTPPGTAG